MFKEMGELHHILEEMRMRQVRFLLKIVKPKSQLMKMVIPKIFFLRTRGVGERLIESFMLAANELWRVIIMT